MKAKLNTVYTLIGVFRPNTSHTDSLEFISKLVKAFALKDFHLLEVLPMNADKISKLTKPELNIGIKHEYIVCSVGGDGTFATASREFGGLPNSTVIGFQNGTLNFLNAFSLDTIDAVFKRDTKTSVRTIGALEYSEGREISPFANDVIVKPSKDFSMSTFKISDGKGRYIMSFKGDGVIIATSMGSTAYNLSAGGPILHPTLSAFIINPMMPLHMAARPIVIPMEYGLIVETEDEGVVLVDGVFDYTFNPTCELWFKTGYNINVLLPEQYSFFEQARDKLGWFK